MLTENSPASGFRLSPQQERLVKDFTESDMPKAVVRVRLDGPVDAARLEQALNRVVERHEILRTTFRRQTGMRLPLQVVSDQPQVAFASSASATSADRSDPSAAPVVRAVLSSDATGATLELSLPPMCADSASLGALVEELAAAYTNNPLKADPVQYADYSEWQQQTLVATDEPAQDGRTFWTTARDTSTSLTIPFARSAGESEMFHPASIAVPVSAELNRQVADTAKALGVPVSHLFLACWEVLLARVSGSSRVTSRLVLDGRTAPELVGALGPYAKSAPITVDIDDDSFADLVGRTSTAVRNAERWQDYVDATADSATADFETIVPLPASAGWTIVDRASHLNRFTLKLTCEVAGAEVKSTLWYDADLVTRADTERLVAQFAALVTSSCHDPRKAVGVLGLMAPGIAPARVLGSGAPQPAETMLDAFEAQVARTPLARAVSDAAGPLTYAELDARANQLAHWLREAQVARGSVVGLCGERSNALIVAVLATWKAGAAYLPLLPDQPSSRVSSQLDETSAAAVVVTDGARPPALEGYTGPVLCLSDGLGTRSIGRLTDARSTPDDTAYVLYTSGSTGRPKGVVVRHRNLRAYSGALADTLASSAGVGGEGVQWATVSSLTADLGNTCIFPALITGGCVHMVPPSATLDGIALGAYMKANAIDVLKITPSHLAALLENSGDVLPRRVIIFGGEALTWPLVARVRARGTCAVWNHYGPTETTIGALVYPVPETAGTTRTVPIGRPLGQTELAVVDPAGAIVPMGVAGELRIGGPGVTAGYVNQPDRTAERFVTPAWATGAPWYGTGDRVWMDASGVVEFIGRVDDQVKIRGYRVEPGEVEHTLLKVPGVREGAVVAVGEISDRRLAAYIVADDGVNAEAVKSVLRETLPEYMVPASVVKLTALPRLSNGKIDRRQLAAQELESLATSGGVAPRNPTEAKLCEIWQTLLGRPTVGVFDNFFELGGHSLLATQVIAHVRRDFDVQLPLHVLFDSPTVAGLAEAVTDLLATVTSDPEIDQILASVENLSDAEVQWLLENERSDSDDSRGTQSQDSQSLARRNAVRTEALMTDIVGYPLSPQQELLHRSLGESPAAHVSGVIRIAGAIDEVALRRAVEQLVARHEILRTRFVSQSGRTSLLQVVDSNATADLRIEDLTSLGAAGQTARIAAMGDELAVSRSLEKGPALRARLLTCGAQKHVLVISLPALCGDVEVMHVLARELGALYSAAALDADPVQYADYAEWQREELRSTTAETEAARAHWTAVLQQSKAPALLAAGERQAQAPLNYRNVAGAIDTATWNAVQATARTTGVSAEKICLAAWQTLLARVSVNSVVETRVVSRGQTAGELADAVGLYAKALPVQVTVEPSDAFADVVARSARALDETLSAATYWPCEMRAQIEVDFEWDARSTAAAAGSWQLEECHAQVARFDVKLSCAVGPNGLHTALWYDETVLSAVEAARLSTLYRELLTAAAREPQTAVGRLNIASADLAPAQASGQGSAAPDLRMHDWIAQQAARTPSHAAVVGADETLTYAALEARAGRIAAWLQSQGVARGAVVGLVGERSAALLAAVVGVWKAGAAFVPMLPDQPSARVMEQLVETAAAAVIVTEESGRSAIAGYDGPVLCLASAALPDRAAVDAGVTSDDPAYVLYTSGSTGRPKGVIVRHRNLVAYSASIVEALADIAGPGVKWATVSALTADLGHTCIFPALVSGGAVHMVPQAAILDGALLGEYMSAHAIDVLKITPSHLSAVLTDTGAALPRRALVFGGEALPWSVVTTVRARGACSVWNHYGPTETTVGALIYPIPDAPLATRTVPIGRPLGRSQIAVVDDRGAVVPVGVAGELWIGGPGVAAGYVAQPERTAERFVEPAWALGSTWYRTGDRVWMSAAGAVEFLGRVDDQVKIRGYRVEPGEVEHVLRAVPGVHEAAVVAVGEPGDMRLVGFVAAGSDVSDDVIRTALLARLPAYMVPAQLVPLRALPRLGNGKIDRRALAAVDLTQPVVPDSAGPRNPVEATLHEIWLALLNRPALSIDDHFFEIGGHSLLATRLVARVRKAFDVQLPLRVIFEHPTIRSLAALVEARLQERSPSADELITDAEGLTESEIQALLDHLDTK